MSVDPVREAAAVVADRTSVSPRLGLVLGSGLGALADEVQEADAIPYGQIPYFPVSTAPGHAGRLVVGTLEGVPVAVMAGRVHMYEGYSAQEVVFPVRVLRELGARTLIITNAAGAVNESFHPGTLMLIRDHINLTGRNPLIGPNNPNFGPRFPDMSEAYSSRLRELAAAVAGRQGLELQEGVYLGLLGPSYETPAEIRMIRTLGADAVGMSTVMEVIAAAHMGMEVLGISLISNMAAGILPQKLTEGEVIETANRMQPLFTRLMRDIIAGLSASP
jgi:purine-nucleoside phosphorylase